MSSESQIIRTEYSDVMRKSYIDYAMSVIISRALPDVRDGLKPVQRRTLYDMYELGIRYDKPYRKCARIVGDTMGKYHPHGDSSIYESLVVMAQEFKKGMVPAVDFDGNILMESEDSLAMSPNGNGGWFKSMLRAHLDEDIRTRGIEWLNVFAVDNVLQRIADPVFVGATILSGSDGIDDTKGIIDEDKPIKLVVLDELTEFFDDGEGEDELTNIEATFVRGNKGGFQMIQ